MDITIGKARAEERARPDAVAITGVNRDTGAAKVWTVVGRRGRSCEPENEEDGIDCQLGPSIPGKEVG
jgi:hypothetical protein